MLKSLSALAAAAAFKGKDITITEAADFTLTEYAGAEKDLKKTLGKIPARVGAALNFNGALQFRVAPTQVWLVGEAVSPVGCYKTALSSARTRIALTGANARAVLAKCAPIDFHSSAFKPGMFASTGIHHTPVLIYCMSESEFHIYALRTFAMSVWECLTDAGLEFALS